LCEWQDRRQLGAVGARGGEPVQSLCRTALDPEIPTAATQTALRAHDTRICPLECGRGFRVEDDTCVAIAPARQKRARRIGRLSAASRKSGPSALPLRRPSRNSQARSANRAFRSGKNGAAPTIPRAVPPSLSANSPTCRYGVDSSRDRSGPPMTSAGATPYDDISYPGHPYETTHPDRLATIGTLFGWSRCRRRAAGSSNSAAASAVT